MDQDTAEDIQRFLRDQNQKWFKFSVQCWTYRMPTNSSLLYIERWTGWYIYKGIARDNVLYKRVPSLLKSVNYLIDMPGKQTQTTVTSLHPPPVGFLPQMKLTALQDKTLVGSENQDSTSSEVDSNSDLTVIVKKCLN